MRKCLKCKTVNPSSTHICVNCGITLDTAEQETAPTGWQPAVDGSVCTYCQSVNDPTWLYCEKCGTRLNKVGNHDNNKADGLISCVICGYVNLPSEGLCIACGTPLPVNDTLSMGSTPLAKPTVVSGRLRLISENDEEGEVYKLSENETVIGRSKGDLRFPHDGYMSSRHARIVCRGGRFTLIDEQSHNGTFIRIKGEVELKHGDVIRIGKQVFRVEVS
ncbi:MAG: FHA domain-containing protein [Acidobacteriota bacterium]